MNILPLAHRATRGIAPIILYVVLIHGAARPAVAQDLVERWPGLRSAQLMTVYVTNRDGEEVTGRLLALGPDTLTLLIDGAEQQIPRAGIGRIQRRDSLKNGAIAGAVIGAVMGLISGGLADCPEGNRSACRSFRLAILPLSTAVYAGIGVAVDASTPGRTTIYDAGPAEARFDRSAASQPRLSWTSHISW